MSFRAISSLAVAVVLLACGSSENTAPMTPAALLVTTMPSMPLMNAIAFPTAPVVQLLGADGKPVAVSGVLVTASITPGDVALAGTTSVVTNAQGKAVFPSLTITGKVGTRTLTFSASGLGPASASVTLVAGKPTAMEASSPNNQSGLAGGPVPVAPAIRVTDVSGNPVTDVSVNFAVASGGGSIASGTATSGVDGLASIDSWFLGDSPGENTLIATAVGLSGSPTSFAAVGYPFSSNTFSGPFHTCRLTTDSAAYCWGMGPLRDGSKIIRLTPVGLTGGFKFSALSGGSNSGCGVTSGGSAYCWGDNSSGQLGDGTSTARLSPGAVSGGLSFQTLAEGTFDVCGVIDNGTAYCWGDNSDGQLGDGTRGGMRTIPVAVSGGLKFQSLAVSWHYSCGLTKEGLAYCWGDNFYGELGDGTKFNSRLTPVPVAGGLSFVSLAVGWNHTCGVTTGGDAYCWGDNFYGKLGDGTRDQHLSPAPVVGGFKFKRVTAGYDHTCALTTEGAAYCWGVDFAGELGDGGAITEQHAPVMVSGGLAFQSLVSGEYHTCGIATDGFEYCWGYNLTGAVGDGTTSNRSTPVRVRLR